MHDPRIEFEALHDRRRFLQNAGMGLGLAMVKNMVENARGRIWFETVEGTGTSFFVSLPAHAEEVAA